MTFEVGENSYVSVTDADEYHSLRGNSGWTELSNTEKEQALVKATSWLNSALANKWKGRSADYEQSLPWPREGVYDEDDYYVDGNIIPQAIKDATSEVAKKIAVDGEDLFSGEERGVASESVGPISVSYTGGSRTTKQNYILGMIRGLIKGQASVEIFRA